MFDAARTIGPTGVSCGRRDQVAPREYQMQAPSPFPTTVLRPPSATAGCTCEHWIQCACGCHGRSCDPTANRCDIAFLPDEGGSTHWGCPVCTPGEGAPHYLGCELIGWNVELERGSATRR